MANSGTIVLHAYCRSSCTWRVRLALAYKEIPFVYKAWNLGNGEQSSEDYRKISPCQSVPALEIDGAVLTDSIAILEFLEERFPDKKPLLPKDPVKRGEIRSFVNLIASGIQPLQNLKVLNAIVEKAGEDARAEWAQKWIVSGFSALEILAKRTAGDYCFGDEFTLADVALIPQLGNASRFKVDMGQFPTLQYVKENLYKLDVVAKSTPEFQPDFPSRI